MPSPRPKVLVSRALFPDLLERLKKRFSVESNQSDRPLRPPELIKKMKDKDGALVLLTDRIDSRLIQNCPRLSIVANVAVGYNNIDLEACTKHKVMVTNTPGVLDQTTADFTWALILATSRRLVESDSFFRKGQWGGWGLMQFLGSDVHGKTLGILGLGRIGKAVARRAKGFGMRILYTATKRSDKSIEDELGASFVDLKTLLRESDIFTIHVPLNEETQGMIGRTQLGWMKPTAFLINTARGPILEEKALVSALSSKRLAGAGLDVFEREPRCERALLRMKNVVLAPHIASASVETRRRMATTAVDNLIAALSGDRPPNVLNYQAFQSTQD